VATRKKKAVKKRKAPRLLISGDAAAAAGLALFRDGKLVAHSPANGSSFITLRQIVDLMLTPHADIPSSERLAIIEDGFISFHSVKGSLTLGRRRGLMQAAFEANGFATTDYVPAASWQSFIFGGKRVEDTKASSLARAETEFGLTGITDDVADALCMAVYYFAECVQ
jgi:Holliday junction resolvasome RuvABC endonuclease subunit